MNLEFESSSAVAIEADWVDVHPDDDQVLDEVLLGLAQKQKTLPSKYFYDARGCELFEAICELPEYYLTRTELSIMQEHAAEMALLLGGSVRLVEMGSGASIKTRLLLDKLSNIAAYVPVDIANDYLAHAKTVLTDAYPHLEVLPVRADFTQPFTLPRPSVPVKRTVFYMPGSTLGNFEPEAAKALLAGIAAMAASGGGLLIGLDLIKEVGTLEAAYNDQAGVTAVFNLNLLQRLNREHGADFNLDQFEHRAYFNKPEGRIEMHLLSTVKQTVSLGDSVIQFLAGETIHTENSYKYDLSAFADWAREAGMTVSKKWQDPQQRFAVLYLQVE